MGPLSHSASPLPAAGLWTGSALIVAQQYAVQRPVLNYESSTVQQQSEGILLDTFQDLSFWRFNMALPLLNGQPQAVQYWLNLGGQLGQMGRWAGASRVLCRGLYVDLTGLACNSSVWIWQSWARSGVLHRGETPPGGPQGLPAAALSNGACLTQCSSYLWCPALVLL